MLIKDLFSLMLDKGVVVVATSNRPPLDLYKDGLKRELFLPFCRTLNDNSEVVHMRDSKDYRMIKYVEHLMQVVD